MISHMDIRLHKCVDYSIGTFSKVCFKRNHQFRPTVRDANARSEAGKGPFKCYVTQMGVGRCQIFLKKALRRCNVQCY